MCITPRIRIVMQPTFPVTVRFEEDNEDWVFDSTQELACSLEWFDSDDAEQNARVTDAQGRAVRLKVEELEVKTFELLDSSTE
jgi:hypothetical protein